MSGYCFTFSAIEMAVRCEDTSAQDIDALSCYIQMGLARAQHHSNKLDVRTAHMRIFNTLVETMCDHCLTSGWRKRCYRYIKRLLPLLYEMYSKREYQLKVDEIKALHQYFFGTKHASSFHSTVIKNPLLASTPSTQTKKGCS